MSGRAVVTIDGASARNRAHDWINRAPIGSRIEFKGPKRTPEQNDRLWAMLTDVAMQCRWHGLKLATGDWKDIFVDGLRLALRVVPNLEGTGLVRLGGSSSDLSKEEFSDLIELIFSFGASNGVVWTDPKEVALREMDQRFPGDRENAA